MFNSLPLLRALTDSLDKNRRRYQGRLRRLEQELATGLTSGQGQGPFSLVAGERTDTASTRNSSRAREEA